MNESDKTEAVLALAERAWQGYAFPEETQVADSDGWEYEIPFHGDVRLTRAFYLEGADGGNSVRCYFNVTVDSEALSVKDAYAIDLSGNIFGEPEAAAGSPRP